MSSEVSTESADEAPAEGTTESTVDGPTVDEPAVDEPSIDEPIVDESDEIDDLGLHEQTVLQAAVEAILFVTDTPTVPADLAAALRRPVPQVLEALRQIGADLDERRAGIALREIAGGFRLYTRAELGPAVERFLRDGQRTKLTQAALETLAVIAYRQPVTRGRVAAIRGVSVDGVVRTLLNRGLIAEVGADADTGAGLYATTDLFLEKIGVGGLDELPSLAPLLPDVDDLDADDGLDLDAF